MQLREELADTDDEELTAVLAEYSVHGYYHDDSFEWTSERIDFASHIREWVQAVLAER